MTAMDSSGSQLTVLQDQINALSDLHIQLAAVRRIPAGLLRRPIFQNQDPFSGQQVHSSKADFQKLKEVADTIRSDVVQKALLGAQERMEADTTQFDPNYRRDSRKRRRPPSPESPKPYVPADRSRTSFFRAPDAAPAEPLYAQDLVGYARGFNKAQEICRLHIWEKTRERREDKARMMRFTIPDVLTAYISLGYSSTDNAALVHMVTCFGPRERKAPHSQSDYGVYQALSQEIAKILQQEERVQLRDMVEFLREYEGLLSDTCVLCERIVSREGHAPALVRLWRNGRREVRHVTCMAE